MYKCENLNIIEPGMIFDVKENNMYIDEYYNVYLQGFYIGHIGDNLTWFEETIKPIYDDISRIIYVEYGVFSVKEFISPYDEFMALSEDDRSSCLMRLIDIEKRYKD